MRKNENCKSNNHPFKSIGHPVKVLLKKQKLGIEVFNTADITHFDLITIARKVSKNKELLIALFDTNMYEARILCAKLFLSKKLTD